MELDRLEKILNNLYSKETCYPGCREQWNNDNKTLGHCAIIETSQSKNDEIIFTGHIPVRCINEYRNTLTLYTNGQAVFLTELKDYQIATCEPVIQSRRPNNRIDKVRHMFNKKEN